MHRLLTALPLLLVVPTVCFANAPPLPRPRPEFAMEADLNVIATKKAKTEIHLPKKLKAGSAPVDGAVEGSIFTPAVIRTVIAGLLMSAAVVSALLLFRSRQAKLATATAGVAAICLGVVGTSVADIAFPDDFPNDPPQPQVVIKYVDSDTVTIYKGKDFPK